MSRLTAQNIRKLIPTFDNQAYRSAQDQKQYIHDLILVAMHKRKLNSSMICMNQVNDILQQIKIPLKIQQLHQLYLYSTYQKFQGNIDAKKRLIAIVNQQKKKIDTDAMATWIHENIKKGAIKLGFQTKRAVSQHQNTKPKKQPQHINLPPLRGSTGEKLQQELKYLISIFEQMERQRQNSGLIPLNLESDQNQIELQCQNIPYDPQLYDLNNRLAQLRIKAEQRLAKIIQLAKDDPRIRKKLEEAIERFQKARIQANQKVGRMGAMKAQKRLIQKKKRQMGKFKNVKLGQQQDLVRAAHLHYLMSIETKKPTRIIT